MHSILPSDDGLELALAAKLLQLKDPIRADRLSRPETNPKIALAQQAHLNIVH